MESLEEYKSVIPIIETKIDYIRRGIKSNPFRCSPERYVFSGLYGKSAKELEELKETIKLVGL